MRNLILLLLGIAIGAIGAANAVNILRRRDAYPRGLMDVMQHNFARIHDRFRNHDCGPAIGKHVVVMRTLANDIETAIYGAQTPDPGFATDAKHLRQALATFAGAPLPANCAGASAALDRVGKACDECHQSYR